MKKSFTLIEILIAVTILSVLFLAMSNIIGNLKVSKNVLKNALSENGIKELTVKTLYADIINSNSLKIVMTKSKKYVKLTLRTGNSLYGLIDPYVVWYVSKNGYTLMRTESYKPIKENEFYYLDKFVSNVKKFKIYKKDGKYFFYIDNGKPIFFEIYKGF